MKKLTIKLSALHKHFNVNEYESEFHPKEDIFIETLDKEYVKINALVLKHTPMISCVIEGIDKPYICAEKHLIMTPAGWKFMIDADVVVDKHGNELSVISKTQLGEQDSYDVALDDPHTYVTSNGLIHHNTFIAAYKALEEVMSKDNPFKQVVIVRSAVQTRDVGFLPGSLEEKNEIYQLPYIEICTTLFGRSDAYQRLVEQGVIRFITTTAIRGISIDDSVIVVDECQSMSWHELSTVVTRVGHRSKIIFSGDRGQNDLIKSKYDQSGLGQFLNVSRTMSAFQEVIFTPDDIIRSSLTRDFIIACDKLGLLPGN